MGLTDNSPMTYGKYKDISMIGVPASYLIWLFENNKCSSDVESYIKENLDVLRKEKEEKFKENCNRARAVHKSTEGMTHAERLKAHNNMFR